MKRLGRPAILTMVGVIVVALIILGTILYMRSHSTSKLITAKDNTVKSVKSSKKSMASSTAPPFPSSNVPGVQSESSAADQAVSAHIAQPITDACTLLTESLAEQIIGTDAQTSTSSDTSATPANNTTITSCAYAGSKGIVQLTVRASNSELGTSENDTEFGSNKPRDAMNVQDYGQSAFWDPGTHELNILGNNNWYIITRSTNSQADTESVAKLLAQGF
jgi:hypothetical protein